MNIIRFANFVPVIESIDSVESSSIELDHNEPNIETPIIKPDESDSTDDVNNDLINISKSLGVPVKNNSIKYRGKTINYFSESGKIDINGETFDTVDAVIKYFEK